MSWHTAPRSKKARGPDADIAKWELDRNVCPCGSGAHYEVSTLIVRLRQQQRGCCVSRRTVVDSGRDLRMSSIAVCLLVRCAVNHITTANQNRQQKR